MNKNIKDEFDSLISNQAPDLWNRIEMSLPEKTIVSEKVNGAGRRNEEEKENAEEQINPIGQTNKAEGENKPVRLKLYRKYAAYGTAGIAACLCIALVALNNSFKKSESNMTADGGAAEEMLLDDAETAEDTDEGDLMMEGESNGAYGDTLEDFADVADYEKETASAETAGDEAEEGAAAGVEATETRKESKYELDDEAVTDGTRKENLSSGKGEENNQAVQEKKADLLKSGYLVYEDVLIRIESISETVQEEKNVTIYHVTILEEAVNMEKDTKLDLKTDELFRTKLAEGECYQVTFYDNKMPYDSSIHEYFLLELK